MKRIFAMVLAIAVLTGCTQFHRSSYVSVTPHNEDYQVAVDSSALTVSGYLSLKNAILGLVEDAVEDAAVEAAPPQAVMPTASARAAAAIATVLSFIGIISFFVFCWCQPPAAYQPPWLG